MVTRTLVMTASYVDACSPKSRVYAAWMHSWTQESGLQPAPCTIQPTLN
jgi:hypothetical protein